MTGLDVSRKKEKKELKKPKEAQDLQMKETARLTVLEEAVDKLTLRSVVIHKTSDRLQSTIPYRRLLLIYITYVYQS